MLTASPDAPGRSNLGSRGNPIHYRTPQVTPWKGYTKEARPSEFELSIALERTIDPFAHSAQFGCSLCFAALFPRLQAQQIVGEVERSDDGDTVVTHDFAAIAYLAHPLIEVFSGIEERRSLFHRTGNKKFFLENILIFSSLGIVIYP